MADELVHPAAAAATDLGEKAADWERKLGEAPTLRNPPVVEDVEVADDDLLLGEVDDKGHGSGVFIAKGDPIPAGLRGLPRRAARPAPSRKR